jgi:hypothetical protein
MQETIQITKISAFRDKLKAFIKYLKLISEGKII